MKPKIAAAAGRLRGIGCVVVGLRNQRRKQRGKPPLARWAMIFAAGAVIGMSVALLTPVRADRPVR
jgi:hypothetical protein